MGHDELVHNNNNNKNVYLLAFGSLGVVFGDVGTSPLYTLQTIFSDDYNSNVLPSHDYLLRIGSVIIWSLILIVTVKYVIFILHCDNDGEGGTFALLNLILRSKIFSDENKYKHAKIIWLLEILACFSASLLIGDGILTPAISVLSAIEGLEIGFPEATSAEVPVTIIILFVLFFFQSYGTNSVGKAFSPIMLLWFVMLFLFGLINICKEPAILAAFSPHYTIQFFLNDGEASWKLLGSIILAVTGVEALYADLGHFSAKSIRLSWMFVVFPSLAFSYLGQLAVLYKSNNIKTFDNPFFNSIPSAMFWPMLILSTLATIIASQALISGAFSLIDAASKLNFCPQLEIFHTSDKHHGQIYIPVVNYGLMFGTIAIVVIFQSSARLTSAYGLAVSLVIFFTSIFYFILVIYSFNWKWYKIIPLALLFFLLDLSFVSANFLKFTSGGYLPICIAGCISLLMLTWKWGRYKIKEAVYTDNNENLQSIEELNTLLKEPFNSNKSSDNDDYNNSALHRSGSIGIFFTNSAEELIPHTLFQFIDSFQVFPALGFILTIVVAPVPYIQNLSLSDRSVVKYIAPGLYSVIIKVGFMDNRKEVEIFISELRQISNNFRKNSMKSKKGKIDESKSPNLSSSSINNANNNKNNVNDNMNNDNDNNAYPDPWDSATTRKCNSTVVKHTLSLPKYMATDNNTNNTKLSQAIMERTETILNNADATAIDYSISVKNLESNSAPSEEDLIWDSINFYNGSEYLYTGIDNELLIRSFTLYGQFIRLVYRMIVTPCVKFICSLYNFLSRVSHPHSSRFIDIPYNKLITLELTIKMKNQQEDNNMIGNKQMEMSQYNYQVSNGNQINNSNINPAKTLPITPNPFLQSAD